jgi:mono/diheme cytochrome c family protein
VSGKHKSRNPKRKTSWGRGGAGRGNYMAGMLCVLIGVAGCKRDDMADQIKLKPLGDTVLFANGSEGRPLVPHTVSRADTQGTMPLDIPAGLNIIGRWQNAIPMDTPYPFEITAADLRRGQQRVEIYCTPCHSELGDGNGMIPQRGFTRPPSFHSDRLRNAPPAYVYNVITNGLGAMFPYNDRVPPDDRWRFAAYIKALQLSHRATVAALPAEEQEKIGEGRK